MLFCASSILAALCGGDAKEYLHVFQFPKDMSLSCTMPTVLKRPPTQSIAFLLDQAIRDKHSIADVDPVPKDLVDDHHRL